MSNLTNRLKALEEAVAEIVAADQAASDPGKPIQWGRDVESAADAAIQYFQRIQSLDAETQQPERLRWFCMLGLSFHQVIRKIHEDRSNAELLGLERMKWICVVIMAYGEKFQELGRCARPFLNQYGQCDKEMLKAFMDSGAFVV